MQTNQDKSAIVTEELKIGDTIVQNKTLLDLCREFDAIDLSECNRRLEVGEKFDAECDAMMEKRQALAEEMQRRLGDLWPEFDKMHEQEMVSREPLPTEAIKYMERLGEEQHSQDCGCIWLNSWRINCCLEHMQVKTHDILVDMINNAAMKMRLCQDASELAKLQILVK